MTQGINIIHKADLISGYYDLESLAKLKGFTSRFHEQPLQAFNAHYVIYSNQDIEGKTFYNCEKRNTCKNNPFDASRRHTIKVEFNDGSCLRTEINGTPDEVVKYYIGKQFNLGTNGDKMRIGAKIWFYDGEQFMQHHRIYKKLWESSNGNYAVDHGDQVGIELYSHKHNGSKYFTDERRKQMLPLTNWQKLIEKEFSGC